MTGKGQVNLEFLAAAFIYIGALGSLFLAGQGVLPEFTANAQEASLNLEARQVSSKLLNTPGRQSFTGKTNWEKNDTTVDATTSVGLASGFKQVDRDKLEALRTVDPLRGGGKNYLNYSQFKRVTGVDNQYRFNFTWMPIVETHQSFTRGNPPSDPPIVEPIDDYYSSAGNDVHYGSQILNGTTYYFLVTSHNGVYNTTYVSDDWNFQVSDDLGVGERFSQAGESYTIRSFQNREEEPGTLLVLEQHIETFGANVDSDSRVISLYRYAVMEGEPLRVKVLAW